MSAFLWNLGRFALEALRFLGGSALLFWRTLLCVVSFRFDRDEWWRSAERFGWQSAPIVAATACFTGGIMVMQSLPYVEQMQAMRLLPWASAFATLREVGPVLIGLMFSGRVGSNNTAELGTMVVTEQVDALRLLAIDPFRLLIAPRFVAMVVMMVALTIVGDLCAIAGAMLTAKAMAGMDFLQFLMLMKGQVLFSDFSSGIVKSACFGASIATISCHFGLSTTGGAEGVGRSVNASVAGSAMGLIVFDYVVTAVLK